MRKPLPRIFITAAVTGNLTTPEQTPHLPITPEQIADACLEAAEAGAAIVHIHVRDPATGGPSMELVLYREVIERIRARNVELILNLTTGPGGRFAPSKDDPAVAGPSTTLIRPEARVKHIAALRPDVCTLDLNTMNSGGQVVINTPENVRRMARIIREAGVKPEIELFDSGDIALLHDLIADETLDSRPLCSFVLGVRYGFQPSPETVLYARNLLPAGLPSPPSALAGTASPRRRRATSPAAMCASASRTASISLAGCWRRAMRRWSLRFGGSSRRLARRSPAQLKRAKCSAYQGAPPEFTHSVGDSPWPVQPEAPPSAWRLKPQAPMRSPRRCASSKSIR